MIVVGSFTSDVTNLSQMKFETQRLELIAATQELLQAELNDQTFLSAELQARVPNNWPPEFYDTQALNFTLNQLEGNPEHVGWWSWYIVLKTNPEGRVLIGVGGFKGAPDESNNVEVGYSILPEFQNQGYASEAVAGWTNWVAKQGVRSLTAETLPELVASIRVLEKNDFTYQGEGSEEGVILYRKDGISLTDATTVKS